MKTPLLKLSALLLLYSAFCMPHSAFGQGTAFTYQGRLSDGGTPASGLYDLRFALYDAWESGNAVAGTNALPSVPVTNGLFTVTLDFGSAAFDGAARWLQIAVRTNGGAGAYATLAPRQPVTPTPYAITAGRVTGSVADAQLSANVARLNASQTFTGTPTFAATAGPPFLVNGTNPVPNLNAGLLGGKPASAFWQLGGNSGSTPDVNFLGTTDNQPLDVRVNNQRALRLVPNPTSPNVIAGSSANVVEPGVYGSTIGGGGAELINGTARPNRIAAPLSVIGGGQVNSIETNANASTIAGGEANTIRSSETSIGGGGDNVVEGGSRYSTIGGGNNNLIGANSRYSTIAGGIGNSILPNSWYAMIPGGVFNSAAHASFAAGQRAKADHVGSFVWADSVSNDEFHTTGNNQFLIRASGGVGIGTTTPGQNLTVSGAASPTLGLRRGDNGRTFTMTSHDIFGGVNFNAPLSDAETDNIAFTFSRNEPPVGLLTMRGNGNVGIGTTAPSVRLHVIGDQAYIQGTSDLAALDVNQGGTGPAALLRGGNVGIGTARPNRLLTLSRETETSAEQLELRNVGPISNGNYDGIVFTQESEGGTALGNIRINYFNSGDTHLSFATRRAGIVTEAVRIDNNGNVGIGTTTPSRILHTVGDAVLFERSGQRMTVNPNHGNADTHAAIDGPAGKQFRLSIGDSDKVTIDPSGNVGIGMTTNPNNEKLEVLGGIVSQGPTVGSSRLVLKSTAQGGQQYEWYNDAVGAGSGILALYNRTQGNLPIAFTSLGNVGIGTTAPQEKLEVVGTARITGDLVVSNGSTVTKVLTITGGADVAEPFQMAGADIPKGAVVVIDDEQPGRLKLSERAYDRRVAGIVSGAGGVQPGITLSQQGVLEGGQNVALSGRVYVQADATESPIKPGDLLTTSATPGHAMKVRDHAQAQGAILGKAMSALKEGQGLVLVLVTLQ